MDTFDHQYSQLTRVLCATCPLWLAGTALADRNHLGPDLPDMDLTQNDRPSISRN